VLVKPRELVIDAEKRSGTAVRVLKKYIATPEETAKYLVKTQKDRLI